MRKRFILTLLLGGWWGLLTAQQQVVERPVIEDSNTDAVDILKIEWNESNTVVWMDVYFCPGNSFSIPSRTVLQSIDGRRSYRLLAVEGAEMDRYLRIPEVGYQSLKLIFEPLQAEEKMIDYLEGEDPHNWAIRKIHLYPQEKERKAPVCCRIRGKVHGRPHSSRLILVKAMEDPYKHGITIPIRNGEFEYTLNGECCEAYALSFQDELCEELWMPVTFFSEDGEIGMNLYSRDEYEKTEIKGDEEGERYLQLKMQSGQLWEVDSNSRRLEELREGGKYYTTHTVELRKQIDATTDKALKDSLIDVYTNLARTDQVITSEAKALEKQVAAKRAEREWQFMEYLRLHPSIAAYYCLVRDLERYTSFLDMAIPERNKFYLDIKQVEDIFNTVYEPMYPNHAYTQKVKSRLHSVKTIRVGGRYVDFIAPALKDGKLIKVSEQIRGKIALIDLWASWCGGCRKSAKSMIPVYEDYKDKGFTIVGVAREKKREDGVKAAEKDQYPWLNLLELNDVGKIWEKYGLADSGGKSFLIDRDGTILAIWPTPEEVRAILDQKLK